MRAPSVARTGASAPGATVQRTQGVEPRARVGQIGL